MSVSQISNERIEKISDRLEEGDIVKMLEVDNQGRVRLSMETLPKMPALPERHDEIGIF